MASDPTEPSAETEELLDKFIDALCTVPVFPAGQFANRLFNKLRLTEFFQTIRDEITAEESFGEDVESLKIHNIDVSEMLNAMAAQYLARVIAELDWSQDKFGFRNTIDKTKAKEWFEDSIIRVAPFMMAEHINATLSNANLPLFENLRQNTAFVQAYFQKLIHPRFVKSVVFKDLQNKDYRYSAHLIFALAYLDPQHGLDNIVATNNIWEQKMGNVGASWITQLSQLESDTTSVAEHVARSFAPVFALNRTETLSVYDKGELTSKLFVDNASLKNNPDGGFTDPKILTEIQNKIPEITDHAKVNWVAMQDQLWTSMKASTPKLQEAVVHHVTQQTSTEESIYGLGVAAQQEVTTTTGAKIADLIDQGSRQYAYCYKTCAPDTKVKSWPNLESRDAANDYQPGWACVVSDTEIATETGTKLVQDLIDGDKIATRGNFGNGTIEVGTLSDETRRIAVSSPRIYGINDESGFFTSTHVFHTTTGLRAIDAYAAGKMNPTATIGSLRPGHVLFRLNQSKDYDFVPVLSIHVQEMESVDIVYDVHLSTGRSFHANGYLTSVSYPEYSVKNVAQALLTLSPHDRLKMLARFPEVQELLSRFDQSTISVALSHEIKQETTRRTARVYKTGPLGANRVPMLDINRTFSIFGFEGTTSEVLPYSISIQEGLVLLDDDKLLTHARVEQKSSTIAWTRQLDSGKYEHARVQLESTGMTGRGAIVYSDSAEPDISDIDSLMQTAVGFRVFAASSSKPSLQQESDEMIELASDIPEQSMMDAEETAIAPQTFVTAEVRQPQFSSITAAPVRTLVSSKAATTTEDEYSKYDVDFTFEFDPTSIAEGVDTSTARLSSAKLMFGNIILQMRKTQGLALATASVPRLDLLRDALNISMDRDVAESLKKYKEKSADLKPEDFAVAGKFGPLYTSACHTDSKGQMVITVRMIDAEGMQDMADPTIGAKLSRKFNKATNQEGKHELPLIFQELEITLKSDFRSAWGHVYAWDPDGTGELGLRYLLRSTDATDQVEEEEKKRRQNNSEKAGSIVSPDNEEPISNPQQPPSGVSGIINPPRALEVDDLMNIQQYDEFDMHKQTGTMLQATLRYHMDDTDRGNFTLIAKTDAGLPYELRDGLDYELKRWIKTKYNKAYIAFMISQGIKNPFNPEQTAKLWYWWQGSGADTLKKAPEYARMNHIVGVYAMRDKYKTHFLPFLDDGERWANALKAAYSNPRALDGLVITYKNVMKNSGVNPVNKICNILHALVPDGKHAQDFYKLFLDYAVKDVAFKSSYSGDPVEQQTYLKDSMSELIKMVLLGDQNLDSDLRQGIASDIEPILDKKAGSVEAQVRSINNQIEYMSKLIPKHIASVTKRWKFQGMQSVMDSIEGTVKQDGPTDWPKTFKALRVVTIIGIFCSGIVTAVRMFMNWDIMSAGQKGLAICGILQNVSTCMQQLRYFKQNPITEFQNRPRRNAMTKSVADRFRRRLEQEPLLPDNVVEDQARSRSNTVAAEAGAGGGRRPKFNMTAGLLKALDILIGVGFLVFMTMELKANWKNMNLTEKILGTLQVVLQGLSVIVEIATLGLEIAVSAGWVGLASATRALACLSTVGAVLGVLAFAVMIALIIFDATKPKPPTEAEKFATANAELVNNLPSPPGLKLTYYSSLTEMKRGTPQSLNFRMYNQTSQDLIIQQLVCSFSSGTGESALLTGKEAKSTNDNSVAPFSAEYVGIKYNASDMSMISGFHLENKPQPASTVGLSGTFRGNKNEKRNGYGDIVMKPNAWLELTFTGYAPEKEGEAVVTFLEYRYIENSTVPDLTNKDHKFKKT